MKHYTIGQIYKLGLLKNYQGEPYKNKATVSRIVGKMKWKSGKTPWGDAKVVSEDQILKHNTDFKELSDTILTGFKRIKN